MSSQRAIARATLLWRRRQFLSRAMLAAVLLFSTICFLLPRRYEATSQLMPAFRIPEIDILTSRTVHDTLIAKFHLQDVYGHRFIEDAREDLQKHTRISEDRRSGIITLVVTDRSPGRALAMDREYAVELNRVVIDLRRASAHADRIYLQQELARTAAELHADESRSADFSSGAMIADAAAELHTAIQSGIRLDRAINRRQADLQGLKAEYADGNRLVRATEAQVSGLRRASDQFAGRQVTDGANRPFPGITSSLRDIPLLQTQYNDLNRLVIAKEDISQDLNEKYQMALLQEELDVPPVAVLDEPSVSLLCPWPLYFAIVFGGIFLSVFLASSYVIVVSEMSQPVDNISGISQPPESAVTEPEVAMAEPAVPVPVDTR